MASVAGKLLQEGASSSPSNAVCGKAQCNVVRNSVKQDQEDRGQFLKRDPSSGETCYEKAFACISGLQGNLRHYHSNTLNEYLHAQENLSFKYSLAPEHFDHSEKTHITEKLAAVSNRNDYGSPSSKVGSNSPRAWQHFEDHVEGVIEREHEAELLNIRSIENGTLPVKDSSVETMELDVNPPAWASPKGNVKVSLFRDCIALGPLSRGCGDVKVISRDDDENAVGCSDRSTMLKACRPLSYIGDRRIRNLSVSRHQRVASNLKGGGYFRAGKCPHNDLTCSESCILIML